MFQIDAKHGILLYWRRRGLYISIVLSSRICEYAVSKQAILKELICGKIYPYYLDHIPIIPAMRD